MVFWSRTYVPSGLKRSWPLTGPYHKSKKWYSLTADTRLPTSSVIPIAVWWHSSGKRPCLLLRLVSTELMSSKRVGRIPTSWEFNRATVKFDREEDDLLKQLLELDIEWSERLSRFQEKNLAHFAYLRAWDREVFTWKRIVHLIWIDHLRTGPKKRMRSYAIS